MIAPLIEAFDQILLQRYKRTQKFVQTAGKRIGEPHVGFAVSFGDGAVGHRLYDLPPRRMLFGKRLCAVVPYEIGALQGRAEKADPAPMFGNIPGIEKVCHLHHVSSRRLTFPETPKCPLKMFPS